MLHRQVLVPHVGTQCVGGLEDVAALARQGRLVGAVRLGLRRDRSLDTGEEPPWVYASPREQRDGDSLWLGQDGREQMLRCDLGLARRTSLLARVVDRLLGTEGPAGGIERPHLLLGRAGAPGTL